MLQTASMVTATFIAFLATGLDQSLQIWVVTDLVQISSVGSWPPLTDNVCYHPWGFGFSSLLSVCFHLLLSRNWDEAALHFTVWFLVVGTDLSNTGVVCCHGLDVL